MLSANTNINTMVIIFFHWELLLELSKCDMESKTLNPIMLDSGLVL